MTQTVATGGLADIARTLALLSLVGVIMYVIIDVLLIILRPESSLLHRAESNYGNGPWAWLMDANFLLCCVLSLAAVGALWAVLPARAQSSCVGAADGMGGLLRRAGAAGTLHGARLIAGGDLGDGEIWIPLLITVGILPGSLGGLYECLFLGGELLWLALAMVWLLHLRPAGLAA